jgi:uncharacterized membrane protein YgcG/HEAT repeat protein
MILSKQVGYAPHTGIKQQNVLLTNKPENLAGIQFAGQTNNHLLAKLGLAGAALPTLIAPAMAQGPVQPPMEQAPVTQMPASDFNAKTGVRLSFIDGPKDMDHFRPLTQRVYDLSRDPRLSPSTQKKVIQMMDQLKQKGLGEMVVVIIPDSHKTSAKDLSVDFINHTRLGDAQKKDGLVLMVNAKAVDEARSIGRIALQPGDGLEKILNNKVALDLLKQYAKPYLDRKDIDGMVLSTVEGVTKYLEQNTVNTPVNLPAGSNGSNASSGPSISAETSQNVGLAIIGLVILAGGIGGGLYIHNNRKKLQAKVDEVNGALASIGAGYKATPGNIFTTKTVEALLAPTQNVEGAKPNFKAVSNSLEMLVPNILARTARKEEISDEGRFEKSGLRTLFEEKGLTHNNLSVRMTAIGQLSQLVSEKDPQLFTSFMARLLVEEEEQVAKALKPYLVKSAELKHLEQFKQLLKAPLASAREIAIETVYQFKNNDTASGFFDLLKTEQNGNNRELLVVYLRKLANAQNRELYLSQFNASGVEDIEKAAVLGLGQIGNPADFQPLLSRYKANTTLGLDKAYQEALGQTNSQKSHLEILHPELNETDGRYLYTVLELIKSHGSETSVQPVFGFYENLIAQNSSVTSLKEGAKNTLQKCVKDANREFLFAQAGDATAPLKIMALDLLTQVAKPQDVTPLFGLLEKENDVPVQDALNRMIQASCDKSHRPVFLEKLANNQTKVRLAAAAGLEQVAQPSDMGTLFTALAKESDTRLTSQLSETIVKRSDNTNKTLLSEKIRHNKETVRDTAIQAYEKMAVGSDIPSLVGYWEAESNTGLKGKLNKMVQNLGKPDAGLKYLSEALRQSQHDDTKLMLIPIVKAHGTDATTVLFDALESTGARTISGVVSALTSAITETSKRESCLPELVERAHSRHSQTANLAGELASDVISGWQHKDYDDSQVVTQLNKLKSDRNPKISSTAKSVYQALVKKKADELSRIGSSGSFSGSSNFNELRRYGSNVDPIIIAAATAALLQLQRRQDEYEEEQRRIAEQRRRDEERRAEERRREEASRSSSSDWGSSSSISSGGFSSGGGGAEL